MDSAEDVRRAAAGQPPQTVDAFLAGLQAGMLGVLWMLAWMGFTAAWQRRSFWTAENLMASAFHPNGNLAAAFGWNTATAASGWRPASFSSCRAAWSIARWRTQRLR